MLVNICIFLIVLSVEGTDYLDTNDHIRFCIKKDNEVEYVSPEEMMLTRLDGGEKTALNTITNSPVKKTDPESSNKLMGPQRTLVTKRSPKILTRRRHKEEQEEQASQGEAPAECKVA